MTKTLQDKQEDLRRALEEFDGAVGDFRQTRCQAYKEMVRIKTDKLMRASDEMMMLEEPTAGSVQIQLPAGPEFIVDWSK